jgi:hypothetical protein
MMALYGKLEKNCATCLYWKGRRNVEFGYIEALECEGKCKCEDGFYDINTTSGCCCSSWQGFSCEQYRKSS